MSDSVIKTIPDLNLTEKYVEKNKSSDFLINDEEIYTMDTVTFIKKFDANTKNLIQRRIQPIAKRLHMESIFIGPEFSKLPWYKYIEYGLTTTFIFPVRIIASGLTTITAYILVKSAVLFEHLEKKYIQNPDSEHYGKPVHRIPKSTWRRAIIDRVVKCASKFVLFFGLGFYNVKIKDLRKKDEKGKPITSPLIISNHSSLVDVLALIAYYDTTPSFLAMNWVNKTPFVGAMADAMQCIYVQPNKGTGLTKEIQLRTEESAHYKLPPFTIFPEGTTTNGKRLIDFKYGAFYAHAPIQPIAIKYKYKYINPSYVIDDGITYVLKMAIQFRNDLEITILPVVEPETEEEKTDVKVWTEKNYQILSKALDIPVDRICTRTQKMIYLDYIRGKCDFETAEKGIMEIYNKRLASLDSSIETRKTK